MFKKRFFPLFCCYQILSISVRLYALLAEISSELCKLIKIQEVLFCFPTKRKPPEYNILTPWRVIFFFLNGFYLSDPFWLYKMQHN